MRRLAATAAAATVLTLTALTACSSTSDAPDTPSSTAPQQTVDCSSDTLDQADWLEHCSPQDSPSGTTPIDLGEPADTTGSGGAGTIKTTPTTVVYLAEAQSEKAQKDTLAIVTVKNRNIGDVPAAEAAKIDGGGWSWVSSDGQTTETANTDAALSVTPEGFTAGGQIQPGTYQWDSAVFDLTAGQQTGGTLMYVDGAGTAHRWTMPADDTGPQVDQLRQQLDW